MSLSPAILDALLAAGATADMIVAAVKADMMASQAVKAEKRAKDAERQRRHRQRNAVSQDVTVTECDIRDETPPPCSPLFPSPKPLTNNPPLSPTPTKISGTGASNWHRLPVDWHPGPLPQTIESRRSGWPPGWQENELDRFRSWAANAANSNGKGRKLDWNQAWHNWLRSNEKDIRNGRNGSMGRHNGQASRGSIIGDIVAEARADEAENPCESDGNYRGAWAEISRLPQ